MAATKTLTIVSNDDSKFEVDRAILKHSGTIETMIEGLNLDDEEVDASSMPIPLPNVAGAELEKVIEWLQQHKDDAVRPADEEDKTEVVVAPWDKTFLEAMDKNMLLHVTVAANYLDIKTLLEYCCRTIADTFKGKTGEQIREEWGVKNEFSPEEEAKIKKENEWCE